MSKTRHYSPALNRQVIGALYHEARRRGVPMTQLANEIIERDLKHSPGWELAAATLREAAAGSYQNADERINQRQNKSAHTPKLSTRRIAL